MRGLLRSGGAGFLGASAAALLVMAGLWLAARDGPSAQSARVPLVAPTPTPTAVEGPNRLGREPFPTARAATARAATARAVPTGSATPGAPPWALPRRRPSTPSPTPTGWDLVVGSVRGDATGSGLDGGGGRSASARPEPEPTRPGR